MTGRRKTSAVDLLKGENVVLSNSLKRAAEVLEQRNAEVSNLQQENDKLRGLLAKGQGDCVYCQLPADDIAKCKSGFPGCARMDDIVTAINTERENRLEERIVELLGLIAKEEPNEAVDRGSDG